MVVGKAQRRAQVVQRLFGQVVVCLLDLLQDGDELGTLVAVASQGPLAVTRGLVAATEAAVWVSMATSVLS
jgi:2-methylaconitate cis-trans-isomerase PrpF